MPPSPGNHPHDDPTLDCLSLLRAVRDDDTLSLSYRLHAAKALLPYEPNQTINVTHGIPINLNDLILRRPPIDELDYLLTVYNESRTDKPPPDTATIIDSYLYARWCYLHNVEPTRVSSFQSYCTDTGASMASALNVIAPEGHA
jgi:hypothetical protein